MVQLLANRQQPGAAVRTRDDPMAAELAAEDLDLTFRRLLNRIRTLEADVHQKYDEERRDCIPCSPACDIDCSVLSKPDGRFLLAVERPVCV